MKEHKEIRKEVSGPEAAPYMGLARKILGDMKQQMQLGELKQLKWVKTLKDGTQILVQSVFGQDKVAIFVPVAVTKRGKKVKRKYKRQDEVIFGHDAVMFKWTAGTGKVYIPNPAGVTVTRCFAVSKDGLAVAVRQDEGDLFGRIWTEGKGFEDLGLGPASVATGISADGSVVSGFLNGSGAFGGDAFIWTKAAGVEVLDGHGSYFTDIMCLSDDGDVAAWSDKNTGIAYKWTKKGGVQVLGQFTIKGLSGDGTTITGWKVVGFFEQPIKYTDATGVQILPLPSVPGIIYGGISQGVSEDGSVITGMFFFDDLGIGAGHNHLAMWDSKGARSLGALYTPPAINNSNQMMGTDVSPDGSVIVGIGIYGNNFVGFDSFRWTEAGGFQQFDGGADDGMTVIAMPEVEFEREFDE